MIETVVLAAIITGITEAVKRALGLPSNVIPLTAIAFGVVLAIPTSDADMSMRIVEGIVAGLTACGLYAGTRATTGV